MVMAIKTSTDSLMNTVDTSVKNYRTSTSSDKSNSELYKSTYKSEDFKNVLDSKTSTKERDVEQVEDYNQKEVSNDSKKVDTESTPKTDDKVDELNEKLKELEEDSKSDSKDKVNDILAELLNLLAQFGIKEEDLKGNSKVDSDLLKGILEQINKKQDSNNNSNNLLEKIMGVLKSEADKLDTNSLKLVDKILSNLSTSLADDKSEVTKDIKNSIKNLMSEISNILDNKHAQTNKVLTLEDILNKSYSQSNSDSSSQEENSTTSNENKELSKEDKFLNSLLDDKKDDSSNKINLFATRTSSIQNQGANTVARGLTINKATFTDDLIKDVKYMSNNSLKELTVKLNPGNLGEITIKLVEEDGVMKANLKANSKETTALLSQNLTEIKKQLSEQNIKISDVNIELYQDDTTFFKDQSFQGELAGEQNKQNSNAKSGVSNAQGIADEEIEENLAEENNNINFFA
ncbi:flagellar hook-length control protein FliK [Clostridium saccharoperbutylacetonicum]|uniref:flagellar hook-length control protein FliK n=1 Tax=Clostridium saccharoperbutylacetonicum TaxID=36745 RepID=UPI0039EBE12B